MDGQVLKHFPMHGPCSDAVTRVQAVEVRYLSKATVGGMTRGGQERELVVSVGAKFDLRF